MRYRDRTGDFRRLVSSRNSHLRIEMGSPRVDQPKAADSQQDRSSFTITSREIGKHFVEVSNRLQRLTKLVQTNSLYDENAEEIRKLTVAVKKDMQLLNQNITHLSESIKAQKTGDQKTEHEKTLVGALKSKLMENMNSFKAVVDIRTKTLKEQQDRKKQYTSFSNLNSTGDQGSALYKRAFGGGVEDSSEPLMAQEEAYVDRYYTNRREAVESIESSIVELGDIFQQVAMMVADQEEIVEGIDENVGRSLSNVTSGQNDLLKYLDGVTSYRWMALKIFLVVTIFMVLFVALL